MLVLPLKAWDNANRNGSIQFPNTGKTQGFIASVSTHHRRSMNAEIVVLLEGALSNSPQTEKADATA